MAYLPLPMWRFFWNSSATTDARVGRLHCCCELLMGAGHMCSHIFEREVMEGVLVTVASALIIIIITRFQSED
jgi:hypothetical protein